MSNDVDMQVLELSMEQAKAIVARSEAFERLIKNPDFDTLIHEYYFKEEAARLVMMKSAPGAQREDTQKEIDKSISAIGMFRQFLISLRHQGNTARKTLEETEQEMELMRREAAEA